MKLWKFWGFFHIDDVRVIGDSQRIGDGTLEGKIEPPILKFHTSGPKFQMAEPRPFGNPENHNFFKLGFFRKMDSGCLFSEPHQRES
jgi:hypothetical protein